MATTDSQFIQLEAERIADAYQYSTGHPSIVADPDRIARLLACLTDGNHRDTACRVAGLSTAAFYRTLKAAEAGETGALAFRDAVEKAEALAEAGLVRNVAVAGRSPQFWAAAMTLLERKRPERWGRRTDDSSTPRIVVQIGSNAGDVAVTVAVASHPQCQDNPENPNDLIRSDASVLTGVLGHGET